METIVSRCAALDVHKNTVMCCVRVPDGEGGRAQEVREFRAFTAGLRALREWLVGHGVTQVAMEATGVYWKPVWHVLEDEPGWQLLLANAQHVKNVPGRKTDVANAIWLAQLLECGLLRGSFVPPRAVQQLRDLTRYRKKLIEERTREVQRVQKLLEDATGLPGPSSRTATTRAARTRRWCSTVTSQSLGPSTGRSRNCRTFTTARTGNRVSYACRTTGSPACSWTAGTGARGWQRSPFEARWR